MAYKYEPIEFDGQSFRLFWLLAATGGEIEIRLMKASLEQYQASYEAVSYTWGSEEKPARIIVNGRPMPVTRNLFDLLHNLRRTGKDRILWVDAICIDQGNSNERSHQVQHMRKIYASAARVVFWLGSGTSDTNLVMIALTELNKSILSVGWPHVDEDEGLRKGMWMNVQEKMRVRLNAWERQRNGLREILARPWFRRVWVIQEVANARRGLVQCGTRSVTCRLFVLTPQLYKIDPTIYCQSILDAMPTSVRSQSWWARSRGLYNLLLKFRRTESHLECDKIYALLGICSSEEGMGEVIVDYEKPVHQVVKDAISHICFCERTCLPDSLYPTLGSFLDDLECLDTKILSFLLRTTNVESVQSILQQRKNFIHVSTFMLRDAVENTTHGYRLVQLLLDSRRSQLKITADIIVSAARNHTQGHELVETLLQNIEGETINLSQEMLISAAQNTAHGSKIMKLFLTRFQEVLLPLTTALTYAIAMNENERCEIQRELFQQWGIHIHISKEMIIDAARNGGDLKKLVSFIEGNRQEIRVSEDLLIAAAKNPASGPTNIDFLLQRENAKYTRISERVIISAVENAISGREILRVLLKHRNQEIEISENVLLAIAQDSLWGLDFLDILRSERGTIRVRQETTTNPEEHLAEVSKNDWSFINDSKTLWRPGNDVDIGHPILWWSVDYGQEDILKLLIQKGANTNVKGPIYPSPLYRAAEVGFLPIMKLLLDHGAMLNPHRAPLFGAIQYSQVSAVKFLLEKGAHTDIMDFGLTPLAKAAQIGNLPVVQTLLQCGSAVDGRWRDGRTALMKASETGRVGVVDILVKHGADIGATDNSLWTALHYASDGGHIAVIQLLLENGADIKAQSRWKRTPLELAVRANQETTVQFLLGKGADSN